MPENYTMLCWEINNFPDGARAYHASIEIGGKRYEYTCNLAAYLLLDDRRSCARALIRARQNARRDRDKLERENGLGWRVAMHNHCAAADAAPAPARIELQRHQIYDRNLLEAKKRA